MKETFNRKIFLVLLFLGSCVHSFSRDAEMISPYFQLSYLKVNDDKSILKASLTYSANRMELPLPGMKVIFYSGKERNKKIAEIITDNKGIAEIPVILNDDLISEHDGSWPFSSFFEGNDTIESASSELIIRDITLEMELTEADSVKSVQVKVFTTTDGVQTPVTGELLTIYVPRMFSLLPVGDIILDDAGYGSVEFPSDLPGDSSGMIKVIARIEDHPDYGTVERSSMIQWGRRPEPVITAGHRALWTKTAPRWMIYTLSILLTGVWAHYFYTIICLIRIKRDSRKKENKLPDKPSEKIA